MMCGQYTALMRNCSAVFFLWLHALLVGPKSRVNFSAGSKRALEPRERVLSTLKELLQIEREKRHIQGVCNPPTESVKMCRTCFGRYKKCYNLAAQQTHPSQQSP